MLAAAQAAQKTVQAIYQWHEKLAAAQAAQKQHR